MRTIVTAIRRWGSRYAVTLACGHKLTITADQLRREQYYIGKQLACGELHEQSKGH